MKPYTLKTLREDEIRYRERGKFDLANQVRQQADLLESGEGDRFLCCFLDRGAIPPVEWGSVDNFIGLKLPSGLFWMLTHDGAAELFGSLINALGLTSEQMRNIAECMLDDERRQARDLAMRGTLQ